MKKLMSLAIMVLLAMTLQAQGEQPKTKTGGPRDLEILGYGIDVHGFLEVTYQSQYIWRGFDVYNNRSAVQMTAGVQIADTGFGAVVSGHRANGRGNELWERWDYNPYYQNALFKGEPVETDFRFGWVYYNYPQWAAKAWDLQELHAIVSMPNITTIKGLVPSVVLVKLWPAHGGSPNVGSNATGCVYIGMLDYTFSTMRGLLPTMPEQVIKLHSEVVYNDGVSPQNKVVDSDWSDAVFGVSTDFDLGYGIVLTPGLFHQVTMDKSVNPDKSETWFTVGGKFTF